MFIFDEAKLLDKERTDFGIPELKKYPKPEKDHVLAASRIFDYVEE